MGILTAGESRSVLKFWYTGWGGGGAQNKDFGAVSQTDLTRVSFRL